MTFFRNIRGYMYKVGVAQLVCFRGEYSIQIVLKYNDFWKSVWTLYRGKKRPMIRHLGLIHFALPLCLLSLLLFFFTAGIAAVLKLFYMLFQALSQPFGFALDLIQRFFNSRIFPK